MSTPGGSRTIHIGEHVVTRGRVRHSASDLFVPFTVVGSTISRWSPDDHIVILQDGDDAKLQARGGTGGVEDDGSRFYVWRLAWPGGDAVQIRYFDVDHVLLDEEVLSIGEPDPEAASAVLRGHPYVLVDSDWFDPADD